MSSTQSIDSIFEILQKDPQKYTPIIPKRDTKDNNLLDVLCTVINRLISVGDKIKNDRREFYPPNRKPPTIGIDAYLARLLKYSPCSKECFVMSLVYIDRFLKQCDLIINSMNIHRIVITSLLISTKYLDDIFYNNEFYSQVGGISLPEMNKLEVCFLSMMDYTVNCSLDEFEKYSREVDKVKRKFEEQSNTITPVPQIPIQQSAPITMIPAQQPHCQPTIKQSQSPVAVVPNMATTTHSLHHNIHQSCNSSSQQPQSSIVYNSAAFNTNSQGVQTNNSNIINNQILNNNNSNSTTKIYINTTQPMVRPPFVNNIPTNNVYISTNATISNAATAATVANNNKVVPTTNNTTIPITTRRRGSCDHNASLQNTKDKSYTTGWVA